MIILQAIGWVMDRKGGKRCTTFNEGAWPVC